MAILLPQPCVLGWQTRTAISSSLFTLDVFLSPKGDTEQGGDIAESLLGGENKYKLTKEPAAPSDHLSSSPGTYVAEGKNWALPRAVLRLPYVRCGTQWISANTFLKEETTSKVDVTEHTGKPSKRTRCVEACVTLWGYYKRQNINPGSLAVGVAQCEHLFNILWGLGSVLRTGKWEP